jgi:hypothetical protein
MSAVIQGTIRSPERGEVFDYLADLGAKSLEPRFTVDAEADGRTVGVRTGDPGEVEAGSGHRSTHAIRATSTWRYENGDRSASYSPSRSRRRRAATADGVRGVWIPRGWFRLAFPVFIRVMRRAERDVVANARIARKWAGRAGKAS